MYLANRAGGILFVQVPNPRASKMFRIGIGSGRNRPLCAFRGAVRASAGIPAVGLPEIDGTLRSSKILHIHKSEYRRRDLPFTTLKTLSILTISHI